MLDAGEPNGSRRLMQLELEATLPPPPAAASPATAPTSSCEGAGSLPRGPLGDAPLRLSHPHQLHL